MLFWSPQDDLVETGETFSGMNLDWDVPKPFFDRGDQGCGIISDYIKDRIILFFSGNFDER